MSFSLKQIRYFIAAAETGQISHAAVALNVSQSAVTAAIQQLEGVLRTQLFQRRSNGVALTYDGSRFLQHARNVLAAVNEAMRVPSSATREIAGQIRLGVTYTVAGYFLPAHLARFQRSFPAITVEMQEAPRPAVERALVEGALDTAVILTSNLENVGAIDHETLIRSRRRLWLPSDHPLLKVERVSLAEVAREPYVALTVDEALDTAMRYWEPTPHRPRVIFATSSVEAVRSMVAAGMGLTILSDMVARPWSLEGQRIETRDLVDPVPTMDVGLAWPRGAQLTPAVRAFIDFMSLTFNGPGPSAIP
jgi:DNA-binding transcriptional LysR family regulator